MNRSAAPPVHWSRAAGYGLIWGVAVTAMESLELPLGSLSTSDLLLFHAKLLPHLCTAGIVLAATTISTAGRPVRAGLVTWLVLGFPTLSCLINLAFKPLVQLGELWATDGDSGSAHTYWTCLFYGSLFVAAFHVIARSERTRQSLARGEIARQQAESSLAAAQFQALRGHVDPAFLQRVILMVRKLYAIDPAAADQLLDRLVGFLRAAMPGVRSGASTLAAELQLALLYSQVLGEHDTGKPVLQVDTDETATAMLFPPLLILPVLDQLSDSARGQRIHLRVNRHAGSCLLTLHATGLQRPDWLSPELKYRLQVGLRSLFGSSWMLTLGNAPDQPAFSLTFSQRSTAPASSTLQPEVSYG